MQMIKQSNHHHKNLQKQNENNQQEHEFQKAEDQKLTTSQTIQAQLYQSQQLEDDSRKNILHVLKKPLIATLIACIVLLMMSNTKIKINLPMLNQVYSSSDRNLEAIKKQQLHHLLNNSKYYDYNHFVEDHIGNDKNLPKIWHRGTKNTTALLQQEREKIKIWHNNEQIQQIISMMKYPSTRPQNLPMDGDYLFKNAAKIDLAFFFNELNKQPNNPNYLQAQYYRYDKLYDIGLYPNQLPLCIVVEGKNSKYNIKKLYDSIGRQNYSNYRVIHVDDSSDDRSPEYVLLYLKSKPVLKQKVTLISQLYRKNTLFNRNYAVMNYCQEGDIIIDIDANDWLIGNQVFQLVNSLFQEGLFHRAQLQQLWAVYMSYIVCCPNVTIFGPVILDQIEKQTYRSQGPQRTVHLKAYLWKLYNKIDQKQFIDPLMLKQREFYVQNYDSFVSVPMFEMAAPKHILVLDQFPYYSSKLVKQNTTQRLYSRAVGKNARPYVPLESLVNNSRHNNEFKVNANVSNELRQRKSQIILKRQALKAKVKEFTEKNNIQDLKIEQHTVLKKYNNGKTFGRFNQFKIKKEKLQPNNLKEGFDYQKHGLKNNIQVGSQYDYVNLSQNNNFTLLEKTFLNEFPHQILTFNHNKRLDTTPEKFTYKEFRNEQQIEKYIEGLIITSPQGQQIKDFQYYLGSRLAMPQLDRTTLQMQYYYANKQYNISQNQEQKPFCILASGYNLFSQSKYRNFLHSIQRMNYTNYRVIWIDDSSPDNSSSQIYSYLQKSQMKLKNKIKIIRNIQRIGYLGNIQLHTKLYCDNNDIVVVCNGEDNLIGTQTLQILNKIYDNQNYLYVYSRYLVANQGIDQFYIGNATLDIKAKAKQVRGIIGEFELSPMKSFRKKVLDAIPLQHLIEYQIDEAGNAFPRYYLSAAAQKCLVMSMLQTCGSDRIFYLSDFLYRDEPLNSNQCHERQKFLDEYKCRLKKPLQLLSQSTKKSKLSQRYQVSNAILNKLSQQHSKNQSCHNKIQWF